MRNTFRYLEPFGRDHECDRQTDGRTDERTDRLPLAIAR